MGCKAARTIDLPERHEGAPGRPEREALIRFDAIQTLRRY